MGKNYTNSRFVSKVSNQLFFILTITFFITVTSFNPAAAQQEVTEIERYISEIKNDGKARELESLIYGVQSTVYLNDGVFVPKGEGPMAVANISAGEIGSLQEGYAALQTVKLLLVTFQDLQELQAFRLDSAHIGSMPSLAYVFLSLGFDVAPGEIFSGIQRLDDSRIVFLYESARPF